MKRVLKHLCPRIFLSRRWATFDELEEAVAESAAGVLGELMIRKVAGQADILLMRMARFFMFSAEHMFNTRKTLPQWPSN